MSEKDVKDKDKSIKFNVVLDPFYYKSIRTFKNENDVFFKEVAIIEKGEDVFFIIDDCHRVLLRSINLSEVSEPKVSAQSKTESQVADKECQPEDSAFAVDKKPDIKEAESIVVMMVENFKELFKKHVYSIMSRKFYGVMVDVIDPQKNKFLLSECLEGDFNGLKAYLIRELFKNTVILARGFKILVFLTSLIALDRDGNFKKDSIMEIKDLTLERQKGILLDFMNFLRALGKKYGKEAIFEKIFVLFSNREYKNLAQGGMGYYLEQFYYKELEELKERIYNRENKEFVADLFNRAIREPLHVVKTNVFSYLKALAIVRLYKVSTREERCQKGIDDKTPQMMILDIIQFELKRRYETKNPA